MLRVFTIGWGVGGVCLLLLFAVCRLGGRAVEATEYAWTPWQILFLVFWLPYMIHAEGWSGFHRAFAPRVIVRAAYLAQQPATIHRILAPLVCMGFLYATPRRRWISVGVTVGIVLLVGIVSLLPQPWRGIVDMGVVAGLLVGLSSILYHAGQAYRGKALPVASDFPLYTPPGPDPG